MANTGLGVDTLGEGVVRSHPRNFALIAYVLCTSLASKKSVLSPTMKSSSCSPMFRVLYNSSLPTTPSLPF